MFLTPQCFCFGESSLLVAYFHIEFSFPFLYFSPSTDVSVLSVVKTQTRAGFCLNELIDKELLNFQNVAINKGTSHQVGDPSGYCFVLWHTLLGGGVGWGHSWPCSGVFSGVALRDHSLPGLNPGRLCVRQACYHTVLILQPCFIAYFFFGG